MRHKLLLAAVLCALCAAALPTTASAKYTVGISENQPSMFSSPLFAPLGVKTTRLVLSYDAMTSRRDRGDERARVTHYLNTARGLGIDVLVAFEHSRGAAENCKKRSWRRKPQCKLPSVKAYEKNLRAFFRAFPWVKTVSPWNEINHSTQATWKNPARAAAFTKSAKKICRRCNVLDVDLLDQADSLKSRTPTYRALSRYVKQFKKAYKKPLKRCGIHNYSTVNRFKKGGTKRMLAVLGCREYWLTETGGLYSFGSFKASQKRQLKATKFMFAEARKLRRIKRIYVYQFWGQRKGTRFDAGIVGPDGKARKAYAEVKKRA